MCNCNNSESSNFYKYFVDHFKELELQQLVCTTYDKNGCGTKITVRLGEDDQIYIEKLPLKGDGDFQSEECIELLDDCDIVCDNPPFSRFIDFINLLEDHHKKYLVLGNLNTMISKTIFPLIKDGRSFVVPGKSSMKFIEGNENV